VAAIRLGKERAKSSVRFGNGYDQNFDIIEADGSFKNFLAHLRVAVLGKRDNKDDRLANIKFTRSRFFALWWISVISLPFGVAFVVRLATDERWYNGCYGCEIPQTDAIISCIWYFLGTLIGVYFHRKQVSQRDRLRITYETKLLWLSCFFTCPTAMIIYAIDPYGIYRTQGLFNWMELLLSASVFFVYIQTYMQVSSARTRLRDIMQAPTIEIEEKFKDVMNDRDARTALQNHLDSELSSEIYLFMNSVEAFRMMHDTEEKKDQAKRIMDNFVLPRSRFEINLVSTMRVAVENRYNELVKSSADPPITFFDDVYDDVKKHLLSDAFVRFLQTWTFERPANRKTKARSSKTNKSVVSSSHRDGDSKGVAVSSRVESEND
jgi:hypothetical protein